MGKYLVGLDEGTTGCKTCIFDFEGNLVGTDYREYPCYYPGPGMVEQKSEDITPALFASIKDAITKSGIDANEIVAIGLSSQAGPVGLLDENGKLIRDWIGWQDVRAQMTECNEILSKIPHDEYYAITGDPLGFTLSAARKIWLKNNEPENWAKAAKVVDMQEYFLKEFGADGYYTDLSSASRGSACDVNNHCWSKKMIEDVYEMRMDQVAELTTECGKIVGHINEEISALTGLPVGCNICVGAHDQNCNTFGCGGVEDGVAVMVVGTFGSVFVVSDEPIRDPYKSLIVKGNHGVGNWTIECFANTAASSFRWYRDVFGDMEKELGAKTGEDPYTIMTNAMDAESVPGANGVTFLPFLQGACVRSAPNAKGTFLGMNLGTKKADMARAVLEGICFEMYDIINAEEKAGVKVSTIRMTGGAAKSPFWSQMMADITGCKILILEASESGCLGAALYAGIGSGIYKDPKDASAKAVKIKKEYNPDPSKKAAYEEAYQRWSKACDALKEFYK